MALAMPPTPVPDQAVPPAQVFVFSAGGHTAYPQLGDDVAGATYRLALVGGQTDGEGIPFRFDYALGETSYYVQPLL